MIRPFNSQEICAKKVSLCASLCLDHSGQDLLSRVSNKVYEACRAGTLALTGFPDFSPLVSALKASSTTGDMTKNFRVTTQRHTTLVILEVLARKWVDNAETRERALAVIESHNKEFNESGQYWLEEKTGRVSWDLMDIPHTFQDIIRYQIDLFNQVSSFHPCSLYINKIT